ncbi:hypothetical protein [Streptomyces sp. 1222.5]|uniref:hypothetical protein n=1 Tax=Streptomyces sp. 1222.5 TaxID=1881026 RepID=UPI003D720075
MEGEALTVLARAGLEHGEPSTAAAHARAALAVHRATGHLAGRARSLLLLGDAVDREGGENASTYWKEALGLFDGLGASEATVVRRRLAALQAVPNSSA